MPRAGSMLMVPLLALLGACGGGDDAPVANESNVGGGGNRAPTTFSNDGDGSANLLGSAGGADGGMNGNGTDATATMPAGSDTVLAGEDTAPVR